MYCQILDFEVLEAAREITVDQMGISAIKGPDNKFYYLAVQHTPSKEYRLFRSETLSSEREEITIPILDGIYKLEVHFDELVLYSVLSLRDSYVYRSGIWEAKELFLQSEYNVVHQNRMFRYDRLTSQLLLSCLLYTSDAADE